MEQAHRLLSGFPTVDAETVLLPACHTFFFFFGNLSPSVKRTEVVQMNLAPKWAPGNLGGGDLASTRLPPPRLDVSNPNENPIVFDSLLVAVDILNQFT